MYSASIAAVSAADITVIEKSWYVGVYGGGGLTEISKNYRRTEPLIPSYTDIGKRTYDMGTALLAGAVIGTELSDNVRIELDASYSSQDLDGASDKGVETDISVDTPYRDRFNGVSGDLHAVYLFGNLWFDLPTDYGVSPYIGGGPGVAFVSGDGSGSHPITQDRWNDLLDVSETAFAYQLGAGVRWEVADMVNIDAGYRWRHVLLNETGDLTSHNFILGASLGF